MFCSDSFSHRSHKSHKSTRAIASVYLRMKALGRADNLRAFCYAVSVRFVESVRN